MLFLYALNIVSGAAAGFFGVCRKNTCFLADSFMNRMQQASNNEKRRL